MLFRSYGSRAPSVTFTARETPPGLLREPGSVRDFCSKGDFARTPTGAGLHPRPLQQGRLRPDSYGSRTPPHDFYSKEDSARPGNGPYVPSREREENLVLMVTKPDRPTRSDEGKKPLSGTSTLLCNPAKGEGRALTRRRGGKLKKKGDELRREQMKDEPHQRSKRLRPNGDGEFLPNTPDL